MLLRLCHALTQEEEEGLLLHLCHALTQMVQYVEHGPALTPHLAVRAGAWEVEEELPLLRCKGPKCKAVGPQRRTAQQSHRACRCLLKVWDGSVREVQCQADGSAEPPSLPALVHSVGWECAVCVALTYSNTNHNIIPTRT